MFSFSTMLVLCQLVVHVHIYKRNYYKTNHAVTVVIKHSNFYLNHGIYAIVFNQSINHSIRPIAAYDILKNNNHIKINIAENWSVYEFR